MRPRLPTSHMTLYRPRYQCLHRQFSTTRQASYNGQATRPSRTPVNVYKDKAEPSYQMTKSMLDKLKELRRNAAAKKVSIGKDTLEDMEAADRAQALERQVGRKWKAGDVYAPHDLSPVESRKWKARRGPSRDVFDALGINPLNEYKNFAMMSEFMTEAGRIKHSSETGLRPANQRKIAKAIRRAVGLGLMPSVHHHPMVLEQWAMIKRNRHRPL